MSAGAVCGQGLRLRRSGVVGQRAGFTAAAPTGRPPFCHSSPSSSRVSGALPRPPSLLGFSAWATGDRQVPKGLGRWGRASCVRIPGKPFGAS